MNVRITGAFDPSALIEDALNDLDLSGLGADGESEYEVTETVIEAAPVDITITLTIERTTGKFASHDEIEQAVNDALAEVEGLEVA